MDNNTTTNKSRSNKGKPIRHLEKFYHTLDPSVPLDRAILNAGFRSLNQFCRYTDIGTTILGRWRNGKMYNRGSAATIIDEMITKREGFSLPMRRLMEATGCTESELFPNIFTDEFYRTAFHRRNIGKSPAHHYIDRTIDRHEQKRVIDIALNHLHNLNHRKIVEMFFGVGNSNIELTGYEIADRFGITYVRVRQILLNALGKLRSLENLERLSAVTPFECNHERLVFLAGIGKHLPACTEKSCGIRD